MSITQSPFEGGDQIYVKDSAWASKFFGGAGMLNQPKRKFTFLAGFLPNFNAVSNQVVQELRNDMTFLVKSFDPPKYQIDHETLDQYNKKRVVQKRINYMPVTITFHDDVDNKIFNLVNDYVKYYFGDGHQQELNQWNLDTVSRFINEGNWGFKANVEKYYFNSMYIAWVNSGRVSYMNLRNPIITDINFDTVDYADSGTPLEITMTIAYEGTVARKINAPLTDNDDILTFVRSYLQTTEEIGQFGTGPHPTQAVPGRDRSPGLGELLNAGLTFYGKYNGKPTLKDALNDFILRPAKGNLSSSLNSWGNFQFGGTGENEGLLGSVGNAVGGVYKTVTSGTIVQDVINGGAGIVEDVYNFGAAQTSQTTVNSSNTTTVVPKGNEYYLNATGRADN